MQECHVLVCSWELLQFLTVSLLWLPTTNCRSKWWLSQTCDTAPTSSSILNHLLVLLWLGIFPKWGALPPPLTLPHSHESCKECYFSPQPTIWLDNCGYCCWCKRWYKENSYLSFLSCNSQFCCSNSLCSSAEHAFKKCFNHYRLWRNMHYF